jgi:hypothetical protein
MNTSSKMILSLFFFTSILFCQEVLDKRKVEFKKSKYFSEARIKEAKYNVKFNKDILAFSELQLYYSYNNIGREEIIPYALLMVERHKQYNLSTVLFHIYLEFYTEKNFNNFYNGSEASLVKFLILLKKLEETPKNYLINILRKGAYNNDLNSIRYLKLIYFNGIAVKKDLKKAKEFELIENKLKKSKKASLSM